VVAQKLRVQRQHLDVDFIVVEERYPLVRRQPVLDRAEAAPVTSRLQARRAVRQLRDRRPEPITPILERPYS
jgi:hypothetical protein